MRKNLTLATALALVAISSCGDDAQFGVQAISESLAQTNIELDQAEIQSLWSNFKAALLADNRDAALQFVNPDARERIDEQLTLMGSEISSWSKSWSGLVAITIGPDVAVFVGALQEDGEKTYPVYFVRHPHFGWVVQQF